MSWPIWFGGITRRVSLDLLALDGRLVGFNLAVFSATRPDRAGRALCRAIDAVLAGRIRVDVGEPLPLADVATAHRRVESGRSTGKLVLAINP